MISVRYRICIFLPLSCGLEKKICEWILVVFDSANSNSRASSLGSFNLSFDFIVQSKM